MEVNLHTVDGWFKGAGYRLGWFRKVADEVMACHWVDVLAGAGIEDGKESGDTHGTYS